MNDAKSILINVICSIFGAVLLQRYYAYRKKRIRYDIELIEYEKMHLSEMKNSSEEMNRSSFRALFFMLMLIGLANLSPHILSLAGPKIFSWANDLVGVIIWTIFFVGAYSFWHRYDNLKNYKEALEKMDMKIEKLNSKIKNIGKAE